MVPGSLQDLSRNPQERPKTAQHGPKTSPRCGKFHPRSPRPPEDLQNGSNSVQDASKLPHEPPKTLPRPPEDIQNTSKSTQEAPKLPLLQPPKMPASRYVTQILEILGRFGGRFSYLRALAVCRKYEVKFKSKFESKVPNSICQSHYVNQVSSKDDGGLPVAVSIKDEKARAQMNLPDWPTPTKGAAVSRSVFNSDVFGRFWKFSSVFFV